MIKVEPRSWEPAYATAPARKLYRMKGSPFFFFFPFLCLFVYSLVHAPFVHHLLPRRIKGLQLEIKVQVAVGIRTVAVVYYFFFFRLHGVIGCWALWRTSLPVTALCAAAIDDTRC
jgi:hypothetical protein